MIGAPRRPGESPATALAREIAEELALQITVGPHLATGTATVGPRVIALDVYAASIMSGTVALREHAQFTWVTADQLNDFDWAEARRALLGRRRGLAPLSPGQAVALTSHPKRVRPTSPRHQPERAGA